MSQLWIFLAVSLAVSAVGWVYFIYFFSIGYGLTISALALTTVLIFHDVMPMPLWILSCVLFVYGIRLSLYLLLREKRSASYRHILYQPENTTRKPVSVMLMIWFSCALLYVGQMSPASFYLNNLAEGGLNGLSLEGSNGFSGGGPVKESWAWAGALVATAGVLIEMIADAQKTAAKKLNARKFVDTGLYRYVRCPNYFGEILMWTGSFLICFGASCSLWQWVVAVAGYMGILYVMFSGARRLELRQRETYGANGRFQRYVAKTPLIIPFIPIYSVAKCNWLKG